MFKIYSAKIYSNTSIITFKFVVQVKKTEKNNAYKKKGNWLLKELKLVDGIDGNKVVPCVYLPLLIVIHSSISFQETSEFNIQFDKVYQWSASNVQERLMFFAILWKLCSKYLPKQTPMFVNIPPGIIEDSVKQESTSLDNEGCSSFFFNIFYL